MAPESSYCGDDPWEYSMPMPDDVAWWEHRADEEREYFQLEMEGTSEQAEQEQEGISDEIPAEDNSTGQH